MKPNFKDINIKSTEKATTAAAEWEKANHIEKNWLTPELIPVKPVYTAEDLKGTLGLCCRYPSIFTWSLLHDVPDASLDNPSVCRILYRRGIKCILSS